MQSTATIQPIPVSTSVERLVCLTPRTPPHAAYRDNWPMIEPYAAEHFNPASQPIYGHSATNATIGGNAYRPGAPAPYRFSSKNPRMWLGLDGDMHTAADPQVSNNDYVMSTVRSCYWAGWTLASVIAFMEDPQMLGNQAWRDSVQLRNDPDRYVTQMWATIIETDKYQYPSGEVQPKKQFELKISEKKISEILAFIAAHPDANELALTKAGIVTPRMIRAYLREMAERGMVTKVMETRPNKIGRMSKQAFWRLVEGNRQADDARELVDGHAAYIASRAEKFALLTEIARLKVATAA